MYRHSDGLLQPLLPIVLRPAFRRPAVLLCQVDMLFYMFADESGALNVRYMYEVLNRHYTTGNNISYNFNKPATQKSLLDCVRECTSKM